jgi:phage terminase small subunit
MAAGDDLTPKQRAFVIAYRRCGVGVDAAREAGYQGNYNTLNAVAGENLRKPAIVAYLRSLESADKSKIADGNEVLEILTAIARGSALSTTQQVRAAELLGKRYRLWGDETDGQPKKLKITLRWPDAR